MSLTKKYLGVSAFAASFAFAGFAQADVCDTPSKLGDMGSFAGDVITIAGSMLGCHTTLTFSDMQRAFIKLKDSLITICKSTGSIVSFSFLAKARRDFIIRVARSI